MRKVRILCVGKTQDSYIQEGVFIFEKRLKHYCDFQFQVVKEANYRTGTKQQCLEEEGKRLMKLINPSNFTVICDEHGKKMTSVQFAEGFTKWANQGFSQFDFVIGGAYGFSEEVKQSANLVLSFSPMTLTHQMFRLFLIEQIYRSFTIVKGEKYHHV